MALTLIESSKLALGNDETVLQGTVMELYARSSDLMQYIPFVDIPGRSANFNREMKLPSAGFRQVNGSYSESTGMVDRVQENLAIAGGDVDVDTFLMKTSGGMDRSAQETMQIKALSLALTKTMIKGDVSSTPEEFDGLQVRCINDQLINAGAASGGDALSLAKLDELIDAVEDPTHLLMNKALRRRLTAAARLYTVAGNINFTKDEFGRPVTLYNDLPIMIADKDNNNDDIMPFSEACASGSSVGTSIYCLSFATNGVVGIQNGSMDVRDMGELDTKPVLRTRIEWYVSMAILRPRAAARLQYIKDAAVSA